MATNFSKNLSKLMERRKVNQVELAKLSGVHQSTISSYLRGGEKGKTPQIKNMAALSKALRCSIEELIGGRSSKS